MVPIKILPDALAGGPDRLARFARWKVSELWPIGGAAVIGLLVGG